MPVWLITIIWWLRKRHSCARLANTHHELHTRTGRDKKKLHAHNQHKTATDIIREDCLSKVSLQLTENQSIKLLLFDGGLT